MQATGQFAYAMRGAVTARNVGSVAAFCGVEPVTVYQWCDGRRRIAAEELPRFLGATRCRPVLDALIHDCEAAMQEQTTLPLHVAPLDIAREAQDISTALLRGFADDGRLDKHEIRNVWREFYEFGRAFLAFVAQPVRRSVAGRASTLGEAGR